MLPSVLATFALFVTIWLHYRYESPRKMGTKKRPLGKPQHQTTAANKARPEDLAEGKEQDPSKSQSISRRRSLKSHDRMKQNIHEYIKKVTTTDHVLSEDLRQQKPRKKRSKIRNHHARKDHCAACTRGVTFFRWTQAQTRNSLQSEKLTQKHTDLDTASPGRLT